MNQMWDWDGSLAPSLVSVEEKNISASALIILFFIFYFFLLRRGYMGTQSDTVKWHQVIQNEMKTAGEGTES